VYDKDIMMTMFHKNSLLRTLASTTVLASTLLFAADPPKPAGADGQSKVIPWSRKATKDLPRNRTGGALTDKGLGGTDASLFFIAPRTTGLTTRDFPDIYWYVSAPTKNITFTLLRADQKNKTILRLALKDVQAGFHKIDLAKEAKAHNIKPLEGNDWAAGAENGQPQFKALYRMALKGDDPKLLATAYIARVKAPPGAEASDDYALQIKNELWYDAVGSLAEQLATPETAKRSAPREQFSQMLQAEDVLKSEIASNAPESVQAKARAEEEKVIGKLAVPDPIDLQSDKWEQKSVPDPIDLN
jgi:hypothetical protein